MHTMRLLPRAAAALATTAVIGVLAATPALAHVTVNPSTATSGGYAALTFRVPTESDAASTVELEVVLPADQPLASVSVKPHPGWTYRVTRIKLATPITAHGDTITEAVGAITWTADSAATAIKPGEFDEFEISAGPLPQSGAMVFKALQTYSDGSVVRWIEGPAADGSSPQHPAPTLTLTAANAAPGPTSTTPVTVDATATAEPAASTTAVTLGVLGVLAGLAGVVMGAVALRRTRRTS